MSTNRYINPETLATPMGYTQIVETTSKRTAYIAGQVAVDQSGNIVGINDMKAQTEQVLHNLQAALAAVNATFADVVKMTVYMVDISQLQTLVEVGVNYLNLEKLPASTVIEVRQLAGKEFLLEIEAIVALDD